ncbi:MAG: O-antigen ligase family protein [Candidatus Eiseniibacteriota bacterium]
MAAVAVLTGSQIAEPNKRVLQVVAAVFIVFLAFRTRLIDALTLCVLFIPFPKATSYGNTNVAFVLLIAIVWLFRVSTGRAQRVGRTPLDIPIVLLVMAYAISFYNVEPENLSVAWALFLAFLSYVFLLYMVINIVQTPEDVRKILLAQAISCAFICVIGVFEQSHPGGRLIPGWIDFSGTGESSGQGVRIGSTFLDYELFGEYCALNLVIQLFMFTRATTRTRKWLLAGLMVLTLFCMFATVTRGPLVALGVGLLYLGWLSRRKLNFPRLVMTVGGLVAILAIGNTVVARMSKSQSVFDRLFKTEFVKGVVPDSRAGAWEYAIRNISQHPIVGHGPYYSIEKGVTARYWTHNVYLYYASIVGIFGLVAFLFLLWRLWQMSRPRAPSLGSGTYIEGATVAMHVVLFMFMVDQLKIDYLRNERYSFYVWFLLGFIAAVGQVARKYAAEPGSLPAVLPLPGTGRRGPTPGRTPLRPAAVSERPAVLGNQRG